MMFSATIGRLLLTFSVIRLSYSERGIVRQNRGRALSNWPAKDGSYIPRTPTESESQWDHSAHEDIGYQQVIRAGGDPDGESQEYGDHADDTYYDDDAPSDDQYKFDEKYYHQNKDDDYSPKEAKKGPADKDFEYIEFVPGDGKGKGKGGNGKGSKSSTIPPVDGKGSKSSPIPPVDCEYYVDDEYNPDYEHSYSYSYNYEHDDDGKGKGKGHYDDDGDKGKGKGGKGEGKGKGKGGQGKSSKSDKKSTKCTDPPGKLYGV
jgi:hypothetical protein